MAKPDFNPAFRLRELRERAKFSRDKLAPLLNFRKGSSIQRYELPEIYGDKFLPLDLTIKLAEVFEGLGEPPITRAEVFSLAGVDAVTQNESDLRFEKTYKAAEGMLSALIDNGFLSLSEDKVLPIALGIARKSTMASVQSRNDYDDVINHIRDLHKIEK